MHRTIRNFTLMHLIKFVIIRAVYYGITTKDAYMHPPRTAILSIREKRIICAPFLIIYLERKRREFEFPTTFERKLFDRSLSRKGEGGGGKRIRTVGER